MNFKEGDVIEVSDRGMKTYGCKGEIIGIEPNTDVKVYNVNVKIRNKDDKETGQQRVINFLANQISKKEK